MSNSNRGVVVVNHKYKVLFEEDIEFKTQDLPRWRPYIPERKSKMKIKARIFWRIRDWWHYPNMYEQCMKEPTYWDDALCYKICWMKKDIPALLRIFWRNTKAFVHRAYWKLRWWSQLRCNGNKGGWRTRFCDYLENLARDAEEYNELD